MGPMAKNFENESRFVEIVPPERIILEHTSPPRFQITALFEEMAERTKLTFRQRFETEDVRAKVKHLAIPGNEGNLDRLATLIANRVLAAGNTAQH